MLLYAFIAYFSLHITGNRHHFLHGRSWLILIWDKTVHRAKSKAQVRAVWTRSWKQAAALDVLQVLNACPVSLCSDRPYGTTGALGRGKSLSQRQSVFALVFVCFSWFEQEWTLRHIRQGKETAVMYINMNNT